MVPTALFRRVRVDVAQGTPNTKIAVSDDQAGTVHATFLEVAQHIGPALGRFPVPRLHCQDHLPPIRETTDDHQENGFILLKARLDIDAIDPHKEHFQPVQRAFLPFFPLSLPAILKAGNRAGRDRCGFPQEPSQSQVKVPQGQTVKVELGDELVYLGGPPGKHGQYPALKPLLQTSHPGAVDGDRPAAQSQPPSLAVAIPINQQAIYGLTPFGLLSPK